jgi:hypothetical protein
MTGKAQNKNVTAQRLVTTHQAVTQKVTVPQSLSPLSPLSLLLVKVLQERLQLGFLETPRVTGDDWCSGDSHHGRGGSKVANVSTGNRLQSPNGVFAIFQVLRETNAASKEGRTAWQSERGHAWPPLSTDPRTATGRMGSRPGQASSLDGEDAESKLRRDLRRDRTEQNETLRPFFRAISGAKLWSRFPEPPHPTSHPPCTTTTHRSEP